MTRLAKQTAQDSKLLKALTVMASLYLPASLLAVSSPTVYAHCNWRRQTKIFVADDIQFELGIPGIRQ